MLDVSAMALLLIVDNLPRRVIAGRKVEKTNLHPYREFPTQLQLFF
jgi:hypothetical protein